MSTIQLPGLMTGIDTSALVQQLMILNSRRLAGYQVKKTDYEEQKSVLNELQTKVNALKSVISGLSDSDNLNVFNITSSDKDILTASASSGANPGSHSIEIGQLATTETWIQTTSAFDFETDYVGGGKFIYSYNYQETVITAVEDETTLEDLVGLINNDANNPGVTASLLYYDDAYHLVLNGNDAGSDYQILINAKSTEVWEMEDAFTEDSENATLSTKITELDQFTSGTWGGNEKITISGNNHFGDTISGELSVNANTKLEHLIEKINEAFDGTAKAVLENGKIVLTDSTCDSSSLSITLTYDPDAGNGGTTQLTLPDEVGDWDETAGGATTANLANFAVSDFTKSQAAQDSKVKVDGFPSDTPVSEVQTVTLGTAPDNDPDGGTFTLTYRGETTADIAWNATANDIEDALELLSTVDTDDITVSAPIDDGVTFTFANTLGDVGLIMINSSLTDGGVGVTASIAETTPGIDGWLSRSTNSITDVVAGVTLNLHDVTETDNPIEVTISRNRQTISSKISNMAIAYNALTSFLTEKTEYNDETEEMGILSTNLGVSFIKSQMRSPFFGLASGFNDETDSFLQASDIGLTVDHHGVMELDQDELDDALDEDFMDVIYLLGAVGIGDSDSDTIEFYECSEEHTTAGTYDVDITISGGIVTRALIKLSSESEWRNLTWSGEGSLLTGDSTFDDNGDPLYPENNLQLSVDLSVNDDFTATVYVKQGVVGALEDVLEDVLEAEGRLDVGLELVVSKIEQMETRIESEQSRLEDVEERLILKFARLERTLATLQQQMSTVSMLTQYTFGRTSI